MGERSDYNEYSEVSSEASELLDLVESLVGDTDLGFPLNVTVVRYASSLQFLTFLFQICRGNSRSEKLKSCNVKELFSL